MKHIIYAAVIFVCIFSVSIADAQNRVVVVPLGGGNKDTAPVPETGQTLCYDMSCSLFSPSCAVVDCTDTGQDGDLQKGVSVTPRFVDNNDGTVLDKLTGLIWLQNAKCETFYAGEIPNDPSLPDKRNWYNALAAANQLSSGYCGLTDGSVAGDWRLPNVRELSSLIDYSRYSPCLPADHPFVDIALWIYWSSTTVVNNTQSAWLMSFTSGMVYDFGKTYSNNVLPVRGGQ